MSTSTSPASSAPPSTPREYEDHNVRVVGSGSAPTHVDSSASSSPSAVPHMHSSAVMPPSVAAAALGTVAGLGMHAASRWMSSTPELAEGTAAAAHTAAATGVESAVAVAALVMSLAAVVRTSRDQGAAFGARSLLVPRRGRLLGAQLGALAGSALPALTATAVLTAAAIAYLTKLVGYLVPDAVLDHPLVPRLAGLVTAGLLASLVVMNTFASGTELVLDARVGALIVAGIALWLRAPFLAVVILGALAAALLRWAGWAA